MKKLLLILFILSSFNSKGTIHTIGVWGGYYQFVPGSITIQLGDTLQWEPFAGLLPTMLHTITSDNIPTGAASFDQVWQMPADTFFQYIPQVAGLYEYVCTPHIPNGMIGEFTVINGATAQKTYVPDDNFEQALINLGYDNVLDDSVATANINTVISLQVYQLNIADLTGIEDFTALTTLECYLNQLTSLDVSNNTALTYLNCGHNELTTLDIRNGNNINVTNFQSLYNPNLTCINVDNAVWSTANWTLASGDIDPQHYFSNNCSGTGIEEHTTNKELLKVTDVLGREKKGAKNEPLFYIYNDGTIEKKIIIE